MTDPVLVANENASVDCITKNLEKEQSTTYYNVLGIVPNINFPLVANWWTHFEFPVLIQPTKETRCRKNSQTVRSKIRLRWRCRFAFRMLTGSTKVGHCLYCSYFRYRERGGDATIAICFVGGTPPVYSRRHDLIVMSSWVPFLFFFKAQSTKV